MRRYDGVRLHSNGKYWSAFWIDDQGRRRLKSLGPKARVTRHQAARRVRELAAEYASTPEQKNAGRSPTLEQWCDRYLELRSDLSPRTLRDHAFACRLLLDRLGTSTRLENITRREASDWRLHLESVYHRRSEAGELVGGEATVCKQVKIAKAVMRRAVLEGQASANPFDHLKATPPEPDQAQRRFITEDEIVALLEAAPHPTWRCLVALCYYGGLRRGEAFRLRWQDVHWESTRLTVTNRLGRITTKAKTREVKMETGLERILLDAWEHADGDHVCNPRWEGMVSKVLRDMTSSAGVAPDGVTLQAMRQTRDTIWHQQHPAFVANTWIGHSERVARKHYLTVPEECYA